MRYDFHASHLGSSTFVTDEMGATIQKTLYYPWGQAWATAGSLKDNRFASLGPRDAETGNDPTLFRTYNPRLYRWLSPDPLAGDVMNPQSLNRYAYALNNPMNFVDPSGQVPACPQLLTHDVSTDGCGPSAGGGGGFGNCSIDGYASDCGLVGGLVSMGAALDCGGPCVGMLQGPDGIWLPVQYQASAGAAGGYWPQLWARMECRYRRAADFPVW